MQWRDATWGIVRGAADMAQSMRRCKKRLEQEGKPLLGNIHISRTFVWLKCTATALYVMMQMRTPGSWERLGRLGGISAGAQVADWCGAVCGRLQDARCPK